MRRISPRDVLPQIKKKWIDTGKAKLVLRDFPLDGEAVQAAMIARCAPPDRFYGFIDTFFADQDKWVRPPITRPRWPGSAGSAA